MYKTIVNSFPLRSHPFTFYCVNFKLIRHVGANVVCLYKKQFKIPFRPKIKLIVGLFSAIVFSPNANNLFQEQTLNHANHFRFCTNFLSTIPKRRKTFFRQNLKATAKKIYDCLTRHKRKHTLVRAHTHTISYKLNLHRI